VKTPSPSTTRPPGPTFRERWGPALAALGIVLAALAAYSNSLGGPFILDDLLAISGNPSIRHLRTAWSPPQGSPVSGRPLLNFSLAVNYALGGSRVWGYHALNLLIHLSSALVLLGIVRRTLAKPALAGRWGADALLLAFLVAALWTVHPLQTEAVTYISERAESLMGFFYVLTLYCFIRGMDSGTPGRWQAFSLLSCLLGVLTKEVIATAPLLVLLYDRTFCAGSFRGALRTRWRYYAGLASLWLVLAVLMAASGNRGVGFGHGVSSWDYALTSCRSVVLYLKLALWPHPLVLDYGTAIIRHPVDIAPSALVLAALLAFTVVALRRWPSVGFACAWFFLILAPTSSFVPLGGQPMAEHRMYLSLAALAGLAVLGLYRLAGRGSLLVLGALAVGLGCMSFQRNRDYRSEASIWTDTVAKQPGNPRAHAYYGLVLSETAGRLPQAISEYEAALRIEPGLVEAHNNLGNALARTPGRLKEAMAQFDEAIRLDPRNAEAHTNRGVALAGIPGRLPEAIAEFEAALRINPDFAQAHNDLGAALARTPGREAEAVPEYQAALRIDPDYPEAHDNLGVAWVGVAGRLPQAIAEFEAAIRENPGFAQAHYDRGAALARIPSHEREAISEYETALRFNPDFAEAHDSLGIALADTPGRLPEAISHFQEALRIRPGFVAAHDNLGLALSKVPGRLPDAIAEYGEALRLAPGDAEAHNNLGIALAGDPRRLPEAIAHFEAALRARPDYEAARENLEIARQMLGRQGEGRH
jgi:tetratricopeptide (TPR) repeat protein